MTLDSRLIGRRRIYVCTRGLAWQDFEARKERGGGSIEPRRTGCVLFHPCRVPFTFVRIMVSRDFPKGLGRNGREGWRNVPPTKLPAKLPSGNIYSSLLDRPKDLKMRFDDNNNNNNRILLERKDFNLSCENVSRGGENRNAMRLKLYSRIFVPFSSRKYPSLVYAVHTQGCISS